MKCKKKNFLVQFSKKDLGRAIADGLSGWGNYYAGAEIPKNFGKGMAKIDEIVGCSTADGLMEASEDFLKKSGG